MKDVIINPHLTLEQKSLTLHSLLKDTQLSSIIKMWVYPFLNLPKMLPNFMTTKEKLIFALRTNKKGGTTSDRFAFIISNFVDIANSPMKTRLFTFKKLKNKNIGFQKVYW